MATGSFAWRRLAEYHDKSRDAFDNNVARRTRNELDIATQYQFSPERVRLFKDDTRQFVQYNDITGFTDAAKTWQLSPAAGETMRIESAESATYVVNYESLGSLAYQLSRPLQDGDVFKVGPRGETDGWYLEQRGADHDATTADLKQIDGGTESTLAADVELFKPTTTAQRIECAYNWYGIGSQKWQQTYTASDQRDNPRVHDRQQNRFFAEVADAGFSTESGNLNLWQQVTRGSGTDPLTLDVGSMSLLTRGGIANLTRSKPQFVEISLPSTNDTWLPIYALRLNPDVPNVNARMRALTLLNYGNNTQVELVVASMSSSKTNIASGDWQLPAYHHAQNSALQEAVASTVFEVPDDTGTQKELTSSDKFGGYSLITSAIESGGNTVSTAAEVSEAVEAKKAILSSDHIVFMARTPNAGAALRFVWSADQDW